MKALLRMIPLLTLLCASARGADWFVDIDATGANNGTSWGNAWTNFTAIQWGSVSAGDTIYLSGGTYGSTNAMLRIEPMKSGLPGAPITLKASQEPGHNDLITIYGQFAIGQNWITIDGAKSDAYGTNMIAGVQNLPLIKDNINIRIRGSNNINCWSVDPNGLRFLWLDLSTLNDGPERYGIRFIQSSNSDVDNCEIGYCWIHDIGQDGITMVGGNRVPQWDDMIVHHCLIERIGDDGLEYPVNGLTLHHCLIRETTGLRGHPDGLQAGGFYYRVYNNIFYDWKSSQLITQGQTREGGIYGPIHIYGNLFYSRNRRCLSTDIELKWYPDASHSITNAYWNDFVFANNTLVNGNGAFTFAKRDNLLSNALLRNIKISNNIIWNSAWGPVIPGASQGFQYSEQDVVFDNNVVCTTNRGETLRISYNGTGWNNAEALNAGTIYKQNSSASPAFFDTLTCDFRLAWSDTVARDKGANLAALNLPGLDRDLFGRLRGANGAWDIGASEFVAPSGPELACTPDSLYATSFAGQATPSQTIEIWNSYTGSISYAVSTDASWISLSSKAGTSSGERDSITVDFGSARLTAGTYSGTITVSSPGNANSPRVIPVTLLLTRAPLFDFIIDDASPEPEAAYTGSWAESATAPGYWGKGYRHDGSVDKGAKFATFRPSFPVSGTCRIYAWYAAATTRATNAPVDIVHAGSTQTVLLNQRLAGSQWVLLGEYPVSAGTNDFVRIRTDGTESASVVADAMRFLIPAPEGPEVFCTPLALTASCQQGQDAPRQTLGVSNSGINTLSYTASSDVGWISISPASGTSTGEVDSISVTFASRGLAAGTYTGTIRISSATSQQLTIPVSLTVSPATQVDLVVDDADPAPFCVLKGTWTQSSLTPGFWGPGYRHDGNTGKGTKSVTFRPSLPWDGYYSVYVRYTTGDNRATNAPVQIVHRGTNPTVLSVNQRAGGGTWNLLGRYPFAAGTNGCVRLLNDQTTSGYVVADAVRFVSEPAAAPVSTNQLQLWLTFDDDFSDNKLDDASGNRRHGLRFGRPGNLTSNWPSRVPVASTPGRIGSSGSAGEFQWVHDGWDLYKKSGDYAGVTNLGPLASMNEATIMCWARYYTNSPDYSPDQNATLLQSGTSCGANGTWGLGRWYGAETMFYVLTNGTSWTYDRSIKFPDPTFTTKGDTRSWHHYAVTFRGGQVTGFFDGRAFTNTTMTVPRLLIESYPYASRWLSVGCNSHAGTPFMEQGEPYPNHGWMNGVMDNVMIYNRVLSPEEIRSVYWETYSGGGTRPAAPGTPRVVSQKP